MSPEYRATLRRSEIMARPNMGNMQTIRLATLAIAALSICFAIAIIGTTADAYNTFKDEILAGNPWWLPLWPGHFEVRATKSMIGAAVGVVLLNGSFLLLCLIPKVCLHAVKCRRLSAYHH
jgi:hypothetical protein